MDDYTKTTTRLNSRTGAHVQSYLRKYMDSVQAADTRADGVLKADGRYHVSGELGKGGMGVVLDANDEVLQRNVAIKMIQTGRARDLAGIFRFVEEAQITAQLEHPNIIPVYELNQTPGGEIYYTMKRISGKSLADILKGLREGNPEIVGNYTLNDLLNIFVKACYALSFAHSRGVIHRDIKPANIMVGAFGEVLLLDWGLARILDQPDDMIEKRSTELRGVESTIREEIPELTQRGTMAGTVGYAAPEQLRNATGATPISDIFSMAATLYTIIGLTTPFGRGPLRERVVKTLQGQVVPLNNVVEESDSPHLAGGTVPEALVKIVSKGLATRPDERYQSIQEMAGDVNAYLSGVATSMQKRSPVSRLKLLVKRNVLESIIIGAALISFLIGSSSLMIILRSNKLKASTLLDKAKNAEEYASNERQKKVSYLEQVLSSAPAFAEQAMVDLERMDKRCLPLKHPEITPDKRFRIGTVRAERNINAAIDLVPDNPRYWLLKGKVLQNPERLSFDFVGEPPENNYALSVTFRFRDAIAAFQTAQKHQDQLQEQDRVTLLEELAFTETLAEKIDSGATSEIIMAQMINWLKRRGRTSEANVYIQAIRLHTITRLAGMANELREAGLTYHPPESLRSPGPNIIITAYKGVKSLSLLRGMYVDSIRLVNLPAGDARLALGDVGFSELHISNDTGQFDFSLLSSSAVESLYLIKSPIDDLKPLADMQSLESLVIKDSPVTDLAPLSRITLTRLFLCGSKVESIKPLDISRLHSLEICHTQVKDLSALKGAPLEILSLSETPVESLGPLENSPIRVVIAHNSGVKELGQLNVSKLKSLGLENCPIRSIDGLHGAPLIWLNLAGTGVTDFEPLRGLTLRELNISRTKVKDLAFLDGQKLRKLDISNTLVEDLTPLQNMRLRFLNVDGSPITDFTPLAQVPLLHLRIDKKQIPRAYQVIADMQSLYKVEVTGQQGYYRRKDFLATFSPRQKEGVNNE